MVCVFFILFFSSQILYCILNNTSHCSQWEEEDERADYRQNLLWLEECKDGTFETWYEKITEADADVRRKVSFVWEGGFLLVLPAFFLKE